MSGINRRHFLQFAGSALATLGLSQFELQYQGRRYGKVLAQSTPRKLALLVGINQYPSSDRFKNLAGCVNDTELQKQLLIHRFGFQESDIHILTDTQATRQNILETFDQHLIQQAKPGDVAVFHFSGHGSQVFDPNPLPGSNNLNSTFVPADDAPLLDQGIVSDIMGQTLFLLMYALGQKTENVTAVLDSCHSGGGTRGNIRVRSASGGNDLKASEAEWDYQAQLMSQLKLSPDDLQALRRKSVATGAVIASAAPDKLAADYPFPGFAAGAFTFLLTQYLWQQTATVEQAVTAVKHKVDKISSQSPLIDIAAENTNATRPIYFISPQTPAAEAIVLSTSGNQVQVWLGGVSKNSLDAIAAGAIFVPARDESGTIQIELSERDGLIGRGTVTQGSVQAGDFLREYARVLDPNFKLVIGLDASLASDSTAAKTALSQLSRIAALAVPAPEEVQYILTRATDSNRSQLQGKNAPPASSIGLCSPSLEIIPNSFGQPGESVTDAVTRLQSKLKSLLAVHLISKTLNAQSSRLAIDVLMRPEARANEVAATAFAFRGNNCGSKGCGDPGVSRGDEAVALRVGDFFQFKIVNHEPVPLYISILMVDRNEGMTVFLPNDFQDLSEEALAKSTRIEANSERWIPDPAIDDFAFGVDEAGLGEVTIIASKNPLTEAILKLRDLARDRGVSARGPISMRGDDSVEAMDALLADLGGMRGEASASVRRRVRTTELAALSMTFEVR
jgi:hypothetical protein